MQVVVVAVYIKVVGPRVLADPVAVALGVRMVLLVMLVPQILEAVVVVLVMEIVLLLVALAAVEL
jgi:hypothetical protein